MLKRLFNFFVPVRGYFRNNFVIACLILCAVFLPDFVMNKLAGTHIVMEPLYALEFLGFLLALSFCSRAMIISVVVLFGIMELINLCYMAYFGQPITASELNNIVLEHRDTFDPHYLRQTWFVPVTIFLLYGSVMFLLYKIAKKSIHIRLMFIFVIYLMAHKPLHALRETKGIWYFQPGPTRFSINNSINVFSYYVFQYLPKGIKTSELNYQPYEVAQTPSNLDNVLVIFGESLAASHMQFYGYNRQTFPKLEALLNNLVTPPINNLRTSGRRFHQALPPQRQHVCFLM